MISVSFFRSAVFFLFAMSSETNMTWGASVLPAQPTLLLPEAPVPAHATLVSNMSTPPPLLVRQIRDQYWLDTETYMQANPGLQECEVLTSQIQWGWVYRIVRQPDGTLERISEYKTERDFRHADFVEPK